jgi:hypothetical protein
MINQQIRMFNIVPMVLVRRQPMRLLIMRIRIPALSFLCTGVARCCTYALVSALAAGDSPHQVQFP